LVVGHEQKLVSSTPGKNASGLSQREMGWERGGGKGRKVEGERKGN
jgi:hypothetical protein